MASKIDFSSYLDKSLSDESKDKIKLFSERYPEIKDELFHQAKNNMMSTIYDKRQSAEYINGVVDTLKYIARFF